MFKPLRPAAILAASLLAVAPTALAQGVAIGVVAPSGGTLDVLGKQIQAGAGFRAAALKETVTIVADGCAAGTGEAMADQLIAAKVSIAVGFLCSESLEEALPKLAAAGIPAITLGVRSDVLMADALKNKWPLFRLAPSGRAEADRVADIISTQWSAEPFALADDGSIGNHDLTETLRADLEGKNVKPVLVDVIRPGQDQQLTLVRHLGSADVTRVFVAADRDDVAVLARDLSQRQARIGILAGASIETTPGRVELPAGVQALCLDDPADRPENAELVRTLRAGGLEPEGYVFPAIAAVDLAEAAVAAASGEKKPIADILVGRAFDTVSGPVRFTAGHELSENPYDLCTWSGRAFVSTAKE